MMVPVKFCFKEELRHSFVLWDLIPYFYNEYILSSFVSFMLDIVIVLLTLEFTEVNFCVWLMSCICIPSEIELPVCL